jgi:hypothetical protein
MRADQQLTEARASGDQKRVAQAQQTLNALRSKREVEP